MPCLTQGNDQQSKHSHFDQIPDESTACYRSGAHSLLCVSSKDKQQVNDQQQDGNLLMQQTVKSERAVQDSE